MVWSASLRGIDHSMAYSISFVLLGALCSFFFLDQPIANFFHLHPLSVFSFITSFGNSAAYLVVSLLLFIWFRKKKRLLAKKALFIFASIAISGIIVDILKIIIARPRPKIYFSEHLYKPEFFKLKAAFWSMPSGHSATAFALGVGLGLLYPRYKYLFWFLASLVALSRIILTQHFLSDVLIGGMIGAITAIMLYKRMFGAT